MVARLADGMMGQSTLSRRSAGAWGSTRLTGFCCFSVEERPTSGGAGWAPMDMDKASNFPCSPSLFPALPVCQATGNGAGGVLEQKISWMERKSSYLWLMDVKIMEKPQIPKIGEAGDHKAI